MTNEEVRTTPRMRIERALRKIAEGHLELAKATAEEGLAQADWIDQYHSPFGKRRHLDLARAGKIPSRKEGYQVFMRRDDVNSYIEKHGLARGDRHDEDEDVDDIVETIVKGAAARKPRARR